ncbi:MAG TPA: hypothetical protein PLC32_05775 [Candidatus Omnitrophota bacterium]|nr:hypothetical protein [Candidatus Omnitrophota bacterium]
MNRLINIGIITLVGILICAANLWAEPEQYLSSESNSYGYVLPAAAKTAVLKTNTENSNVAYQQAERGLDLEDRSEDIDCDSEVEDAIPAIAQTPPMDIVAPPEKPQDSGPGHDPWQGADE